MQISRNKEELATHSYVRFNGPGGKLEQLQKAIALNHSHSIFNGIIEVPKSAQQTSASQLSKNLLLSSKAEVHSKPELRIIADDVCCTHGATISQLEEDELFYLKSRGLTENDASSLIINGYAQEIIKGLPLEPSRWSKLNKFLEV